MVDFIWWIVFTGFAMKLYHNWKLGANGKFHCVTTISTQCFSSVTFFLQNEELLATLLNALQNNFNF